MVYSTDIFRSLWIWQVYGGWRGLYQLAIEPWVGYPVRLEQAIEAGRQRVVQAGEVIEYEVAMVVYTGLSRVHRIQQQGQQIVVQGSIES